MGKVAETCAFETRNGVGNLVADLRSGMPVALLGSVTLKLNTLARHVSIALRNP